MFNFMNLNKSPDIVPSAPNLQQRLTDDNFNPNDISNEDL